MVGCGSIKPWTVCSRFVLSTYLAIVLFFYSKVRIAQVIILNLFQRWREVYSQSCFNWNSYLWMYFSRNWAKLSERWTPGSWQSILEIFLVLFYVKLVKENNRNEYLDETAKSSDLRNSVSKKMLNLGGQNVKGRPGGEPAHQRVGQQRTQNTQLQTSHNELKWKV